MRAAALLSAIFRFEDLFDPARERRLCWPKLVRIRFRFDC
jgi:hypothetical protein